MATLAFDGRLPGLAVTAVLPQTTPNPLRLDVTGFVGFAERGPYHTPVIIEDMDQYRAIFGRDLLIARDGGLPVFANLPKAVQTFFDNGGRRCYVVQVGGGNSDASANSLNYNQFTIPGLLQFVETRDTTPEVQPSNASQVQTQPSTPEAAHPKLGKPVMVKAAWPGHWSDKLSVATQLWPKLVSTPTSNRTDTYRACYFHDATTLKIDLSVSSLNYIRKGDLLRLNFEKGQSGKSYFFPVWNEVEATNPPPPAGSTRLGTICVTATTNITPNLPLPQNQAELDALGSLQTVQLLTFDVLIREGNSPGESWIKLQFGPGADYWADRLAPILEEGKVYRPEQIASHSLLLSAPEATQSVEPNQTRPFYFPITHDPDTAMSGSLQLSPMSETIPTSAGYQIRNEHFPASDGLAVYNPVGWFLDPAFIDNSNSQSETDKILKQEVVRVRDLMDRADQMEYGDWQTNLRRNESATPTVSTRRLRGLHSLLRVDEVAIIALPDACHRSWSLAQDHNSRHRKLGNKVESGVFHNCVSHPKSIRHVHTNSSSRGASNEGNNLDDLSWDISDDDHALPLLKGLPELDPPEDYNSSITQKWLTQLQTLLDAPAIPRHKLLKVALALQETLGNQAFDLPALTTALQKLVASAKKSGPLDPAVLDELKQAVEALPIIADSPLQKLLTIQQALINMCAARTDVLAVLTLPQHFQNSDVVSWQQSLVDLQTGGTNSNSRTSKQQIFWSGAHGTTALDTVALSYAAVYHPWLQIRETYTTQFSLVRAIGPEGAVCGMIAARELARGAWIAPANVPFTEVLGLQSGLKISAPSVELFNAQINILHQQSGQFSALSGHTLSVDRDFVQISVRRLLIYLRKLAWTFGMQYVFETNDERFRAQVQATFEGALNTILAQGGISAYQVITDDGIINSDYDRENGRFMVVLKIAPTTPVEFITVTLMRSGTNGLSVVEGAV